MKTCLKSYFTLSQSAVIGFQLISKVVQQRGLLRCVTGLQSGLTCQQSGLTC